MGFWLWVSLTKCFWSSLSRYNYAFLYEENQDWSEGCNLYPNRT